MYFIFETFTIINTYLFEIFIGTYLIGSICIGIIFTNNKVWNYTPTVNSLINSYQLFIVALLVCLNDTAMHQILSFNGSIFHTGSSTIVIIITFVASLFTLVFTSYSSNRQIFHYEYLILIFFAVFSVIILCNSQDCISVYMAIELQALSFYVLASFYWKSEFNVDAGIKYFVLGAVASCLLLFGFANLYLLTGSFLLETYQQILYCNAFEINLNVVAINFIMISLLFKIGCFPFQAWVCDVYEGTLLTTTVIFALLPKVAIIYLIIKLFFISFLGFNEVLQKVLLVLSVATIGFGSITAIYQRRLKRLFILSSITHTGFLVGAIACFSLESIKTCVFYLATYIPMTFLLFAIIATTKRGNKLGFLKYIINWLNFYKRNIVFTAIITLLMLSLAGIPPLIGFYNKLLVFVSLIKDGNNISAIIISLLSCVSCFYYIRIIKILIFSNTENSVWITLNNRIIETLIMAITFLIVTFLLKPESLMLVSYAVALSFVGL